MIALRTAHPRRAFTLAEMVVVVALIALLTVGIGRLFAGVSEAVGRGLAASELDATARAIENALRTDFQRVNRMRSEDTFLVIRAIELGGDPERPIYLTADDREADVLEGIEPYDPASRAVHTRLDEMAFLSAVPGVNTTFRSQQDDGYFTTGAPGADAARIYYGHGLRPKLGPVRERADGTLDEPLRQFASDGWFGSPPGEDRRGFMGGGTIGGRNQFASDWVLARQALLLYGAEATGRADPDVGQPRYGENREYAPYIRDLENLSRFWGDLLSDAPGGAENYTWPGPANPTVIDTGDARPDPRLIMHGRVDVCAQSLESVRRWLEGEEPVWNAGDNIYTATPYDAIQSSSFGVDNPDVQQQIAPQRYGLSDDDLRGTGNESAVQRWLWRRAADRETSPRYDTSTTNLLSMSDDGNPLDDLTYNYIGIRSALAGVLARPLVELTPAVETRADPQNLAGYDEAFRYAQEHDASMDTHAVIAARCSRFEIAWSDGSTWNEDIDLDEDMIYDVRTGDLVWFEPARTNARNQPNDQNADRMTYEGLQEQFSPEDSNAIKWRTAYTDPDALDLDQVRGTLGVRDGFELNLSPEVGFGDADYFDGRATFDNVGASPLGRRLKVATGDDPVAISNGPGDKLPFYNPDVSGGAPSVDGWPEASPSSPTDDINEYLAIWPFRVPTSTGEWGEQFEKNILIRVRFTLHDPQGRLDDGRDYEVVLQMRPRDENG